MKIQYFENSRLGKLKTWKTQDFETQDFENSRLGKLKTLKIRLGKLNNRTTILLSESRICPDQDQLIIMTLPRHEASQKGK